MATMASVTPLTALAALTTLAALTALAALSFAFAVGKNKFGVGHRPSTATLVALGAEVKKTAERCEVVVKTAAYACA